MRDNLAAATPLALAPSRRLASSFLRRSIVRSEFPLAALFPRIPPPAKPVPSAFSPAGCSDRRPPDRIHRCPRTPGRAQSLLAKPGCPRNPTRLSEPERSPFLRRRLLSPRPRSIPCAAALAPPQENTRRARQESPSISTETARIVASADAPKKTNWDEASKSSPPRTAAAARATVPLVHRFPLPSLLSGAPPALRFPSSPSA